jgi:hypothetical protein
VRLDGGFDVSLLQSVRHLLVDATPAALVPPQNGSLPKALPTQTIPGVIGDVVGVEAPAPAASSAVQLELELVDSQGATYLARGPGVIIWVSGK